MKLDFMINTLALIFFANSALVFGMVATEVLDKVYEGEVLGGYYIDETPTMDLEELPESTENSLDGPTVTNVTNINTSETSSGSIFDEAFEWIDRPYRLLVIPQTYFDEDATFRKDITIEGDVTINDINYIFPDEDNDGVLTSDGQGNLTWEAIEAGITNFLGLSDTPNSYSGTGSQFVAVNSAGTALEFVDAPEGTTISGTDNRIARFNAAGDNVEDASINDLYTGGVAMTIGSGGEVGIGSTNPASLFSVGANNQFVINSTGNITRLNGVTISFPGSQGAANSTLRNDGAGTLTWVDPTTASGVLGYWNRVGTALSPTTITDSVGIGISNPGWLLDVTGSASIGNNLAAQLEGGTFFGRTQVSENQLALSDGSFGGTWTARGSSLDWRDVAVSSSGKYQTAVPTGGQIYTSSDYGITWTARDSSRDWRGVAVSSDGRYQTAVVFGGQIYTSSNYGVTWTARDSSANWHAVGMSSEGKYQVVATYGGSVVKSSDYGVTWAATGSVAETWITLSMSSDGKYILGTPDSGFIYTSYDYGASWTARDSDRLWRGSAMSSDGRYMTAVETGGQIYTSSDYGATWTAQDSNRDWFDVAVSGSGKYQVALGSGISIYVSYDYGDNWVAKDSTRSWRTVAISSDGKYATATVEGGGLIYTTAISSYIAGGNVGIGTTVPGSLLSVSGSVAIGSTYASYAAPTNGLLVEGAVGIGTTNPGSNALTVAGHIGPSANDTYDLGSDSFRFRDLYLGGDTLHIGTSTSDEYAIAYDTTNNRLGFNINGSGNPEFVFDSNGRLGIGTTSPLYGLDIVGSARSTGLLTQTLVLSAASTSLLTSQPGFSGFTNFGGGIGTGVQTDSILGMQRINAYGNLVNVGSIQGGQTLLTTGGTFATKVDYTGLNAGSSVALADYDSDGDIDIAATNDNFAVNTVSVYMNNGDGTYAAKSDYTTGTSPRNVTTSDFNGDGKADLAVANGSSTTISVFINNGDGTFATKVDYAALSSVFGITSGDVNNDGKADIAIGSTTSANLSVFINNGDGTFASKVDTSSASSSGVLLADVNGDSKLDLIGVNSTTDVISVHFNNGDGTFAARSTYATGDNPEMGAVGDVSGDGKADIAVTNISDNDMSVFINDGDGTFATKVDYATSTFPRGITMGDITGDGKADIAVASSNGSVASVFINNGDGTFATKVDYSAGSSPRGIKIGDVNKDGKADMVVANTSNAAVFINNASPMLFAQSSTGFVGVGTTGPGSKLSVAGTVGIGATYASYAAPTNGMLVQGAVGIGTTNAGSHALSVVGTAGLSTGTAWTNTSDRRFKDEQSELYGSALSKISQLRPVTYEWNELHNSMFGEDPGLNYGFIAQEVGEIIPEMVTQDSNGYYYYNPSGFEAILTAAVQEQQGMIDELREKLDEIDSSDESEEPAEAEPEVDIDFDTSIPEGLDGLAEILEVQDTDEGGKRAVFFSNLNVMGTVTADSFSTPGEITAGFLTIKGDDNSISVLGTETLRLQNGVAPGNIEAFSGTLVLTADGGIVADAGIEAKTVTIEKVAVLGASALTEEIDGIETSTDSTVGEGALEPGVLEVTINNSNTESNSKIFITPTTKTGGQTLIVKSKVDGSFTVSIDSAYSEGIKFDYWIVEVR